MNTQNPNEPLIAPPPPPAPAAVPPPSPPPASAAETPTIMLSVNGVQSGPYTVAALRQMSQCGEITTQAAYWTQGMAEWKPIAELLGSNPTLSPVPPAPSPATPAAADLLATAGDFMRSAKEKVANSEATQAVMTNVKGQYEAVAAKGMSKLQAGQQRSFIGECIDALRNFIRNISNFEGRIGLREYCFTYFSLAIICLLFALLAAFLLPDMGNEAENNELYTLYGYGVGLIVELLALSLDCRRLHDCGWDGRIQLVKFIPYLYMSPVLWLVYIIFFLNGTKGANKYGPEPGRS